ncbi:MAG: hypothetical protein P9X24_03385 [Candidatus Hatepunaea meridiana]|nr:hypothetical protein [Candidatus Hatepunaea meridiana]
MLTTKRVIIATICGFIFGLVCMYLASSSPDVTTNIKLIIVVSRTLMGFTIGISALRMQWWLHGIVIGIITSIPMALPVMSDPYIFIGTFALGVIYGVLTELITTVLFKAKSVGCV